MLFLLVRVWFGGLLVWRFAVLVVWWFVVLHLVKQPMLFKCHVDAKWPAKVLVDNCIVPQPGLLPGAKGALIEIIENW